MGSLDLEKAVLVAEGQIVSSISTPGHLTVELVDLDGIKRSVHFADGSTQYVFVYQVKPEFVTNSSERS